MIKTHQLTSKLLEKVFLYYLEERLHIFISKIRLHLVQVGCQFHLCFIQVIADKSMDGQTYRQTDGHGWADRKTH